jgi:hypothetical protein
MAETLQVACYIINFGRLHRELLAELARSRLMTYPAAINFIT